MVRTNVEKSLISKVLSGALDGRVGRDYYTSGGSIIWTAIKGGVIRRYKQGPSSKVFLNKESVRKEGVLRILKEWKTEDEILSFLQKFGWLLNDLEVNAYSAKFKPAR